jgi:hypothetical protein
MKAIAVILPLAVSVIFCSKADLPVEAERQLTAEESVASIRQEIGRIRGMTLVKLSYGKPDPSGCGSSTEDVYLDEKGRVRRLVYVGTCSPAAFRWVERIEYFSEGGDLIHLIFVDYNQPMLGSRGSAFFHGGKAVRTSAFTAGGEKVRQLKVPPRYNTTAAEIMKRLGIDAVRVRKGRKVVLGPPGKNEIAVINTNDVVIRSAPSRSGKRVNNYTSEDPLPRALRYSDGIHVFCEAKVLDVGPEETIEPWGAHRWYRVTTQSSFTPSITGWVFGGFLEPVAH